ncbi:hypothetical protein NXV73_00190 [Bacteroides salyersiae]|nr:hypothetical protein [Bacteroides salyersiae]
MGPTYVEEIALSLLQSNGKVCSALLEILSAALNALPGRSRDRVTPKS